MTPSDQPLSFGPDEPRCGHATLFGDGLCYRCWLRRQDEQRTECRVSTCLGGPRCPEHGYAAQWERGFAELTKEEDR